MKSIQKNYLYFLVMKHFCALNAIEIYDIMEEKVKKREERKKVKSR